MGTLTEYKVEYTPEGRARSHRTNTRDIAAIREKYGFPFFSCNIALANSHGDVDAAIRELLKAFK
jgi:translation elongation factor EF-Ts